MPASNGSSTTNTSGDSNVGFDFTKKGGSDCISDSNMAEITRRIQGFITSSTAGDVVFSQNPPQNKLKLWVQLDETGDIIGGKIYSYDSDSGLWIDGHFIPDSDKPLKLFIKEVAISADDQVVDFSHSFSTLNYIYTVVNKTEPLAEGRWYQESRDGDDLSLHFLQMIGVTVEVRILEYNNEVI